MSPIQRRQQRAGLWWLAGAGCVLLSLLWALGDDRRLNAFSIALLVAGGLGVVIGSVLGLTTLTFWGDRRRRRARRRARSAAH